MSEAQYDVVVFGASSFVGKILVNYMATTFGIDEQLRWCIAGRSQSKLEAVQQQAKTAASAAKAPDILLADAANREQLNQMCQRTRVVVSTVGPYALYGEPLIAACVDHGTDYCDLTGEPHWVMKMISQYQERAAQTGARIVNCCGFDSIPSDLGVYFTQMQAQKVLGQVCDEINMRIRFRGGFSGGTLASLANAVTELTAQPQLRKALLNPYCLCSTEHPFTVRQTQINAAEFDQVNAQWRAPFVMEGINTRVVHRSNELLGVAYGEQFKYDEAVSTGGGRKGRKRASRGHLALKALTLGLAIAPLRALLTRFVLPKPGEGPTQQQQDQGNYTLTFFGQVHGKGKIRCTVSGDKDPGYGSTAKILGQVAAHMATAMDKDRAAGGFWTPAALFKEDLIPRLQTYSGLTFTLEDSDMPTGAQ